MDLVFVRLNDAKTSMTSLRDGHDWLCPQKVQKNLPGQPWSQFSFYTQFTQEISTLIIVQEQARDWRSRKGVSCHQLAIRILYQTLNSLRSLRVQNHSTIQAVLWILKRAVNIACSNKNCEIQFDRVDHVRSSPVE